MAIPVLKSCRGKSSAEVNWSIQPELLSNLPWLYIFIEAQLIRTGLDLLSLKGAPAVHFNLPLLIFYLYTTFKTGIAAAVSLFLQIMGGYSFKIGEVWWMGKAKSSNVNKAVHVKQWSAAAMTGAFYTIHPTYLILQWSALHLLWQSYTKTIKWVCRRN